MGDTLDTVYEITKLIKKSPKYDVVFNKIKNDVTAGSPGIRILRPTRWTVRAESLVSISENYQTLTMTWEAVMSETKDTEMKAGVAAHMERYDFFYGIELGKKNLNMVDNLSCSLQAKKISACEGQRLVSITLATFEKIRSDESFNLFWDYVESRRSTISVASPKIPRLLIILKLVKVHLSILIQPRIIITESTLKQLILSWQFKITIEWLVHDIGC